MANHFDYTTYHVTYVDDLFGLKTLTFTHQETANDFCNDLLVEKCEFIHLYKMQTSTIFMKNESALYVP